MVLGGQQRRDGLGHKANLTPISRFSSNMMRYYYTAQEKSPEIGHSG
jgi:hypothetical protein